MISTLLRLALLSVVAGSLGACAFGELRPGDPMDRKYSLEQAQKRYTDLVRWGKFGEASVFVAEDAREAFLRDAPGFKTVRFTDYDSDPIELDDAKAAATVVVTYSAYSMSSPIETSVQETQEWSREGKAWNVWRVRSRFEGLGPLTASSSP